MLVISNGAIIFLNRIISPLQNMVTPVQQNLNPLDFSKNENTWPHSPSKPTPPPFNLKMHHLVGILHCGLVWISVAGVQTSFSSAKMCRVSRNNSSEPWSNVWVLRSLSWDNCNVLTLWSKFSVPDSQGWCYCLWPAGLSWCWITGRADGIWPVS